jgi:integrase
MHNRKRWRLPVNEFAIARGATAPITSKETALKVWEPKFLAEIVAGLDPRIPPDVPRAAIGVTVAEFLDTYHANYVEAEGLRDPATIKGRLKAIKAVLGDQPVTVLEKPPEVLRFKAAYRKGREVATVNRALSTLRAAINWGRFQDPPYLATTPFHRFGVTIRTKEEIKRDRRIGLREEQALLAASGQMGGAEHKYVGSAMHDRIIGALETCCRRGEMLRIQNRHVDWERHQIAIPGRHAKDAENCRIPFDPQGRMAPIHKRRASLGPNAYGFGSPPAEFVRGQLQDVLGVAAPDRQRARDEACEARCTRRSRQAAADRPALARPASRGRVSPRGGARGHPHDPTDARPCRHQADAAVPEHHGRRATEGMTGVWERRRQLRAVSQ